MPIAAYSTRVGSPRSKWYQIGVILVVAARGAVSNRLPCCLGANSFDELVRAASHLMPVVALNVGRWCFMFRWYVNQYFVCSAQTSPTWKQCTSECTHLCSALLWENMQNEWERPCRKVCHVYMVAFFQWPDRKLVWWFCVCFKCNLLHLSTSWNTPYEYIQHLVHGLQFLTELCSWVSIVMDCTNILCHTGISGDACIWYLPEFFQRHASAHQFSAAAVPAVYCLFLLFCFLSFIQPVKPGPAMQN